MNTPIERCRNHKGQRSGNRQGNHPLRQYHAGHDQAKFAVVGQADAAEKGTARAQAEQQKEKEEQHALERQQHGHDQGKLQGSRIRQAANANLQKEADQKDFLDAPQRVGQLGGALVFGQHGTKGQCTQFGAQAQLLEAVTAQHQRQQQAEQHHQLLVAADIEQLKQQRPQQWQTEQQQCPGRRHLAAGQTHHHQGNQVLDDQHTNRHPPVEGAQFALALQHLGRQHRAGKRQGNGQQQPLLPGQLQQQQNRREEDQTGNSEMQQTTADHLEPHQIADFQLEAHGKQQQQHAQVGDVIQRCAVTRANPDMLAKTG